MIEVWSWNWARLQARQIIRAELFRNKSIRTIWSYKILISKYKSIQAKWVEWKVRICILQYLFACMQRHFDKRIANWETKEQILFN